ncbi:IS3 family transposase [Nonomuraea sp. NPDC004702]
MSAHPFIEAEKQGGHSVKRACELLGASRAAFYERSGGAPGPRAMRDAELVERIAEVRARSRGSYGAPRVHAQLQRDGQRCGRRRVARLMRALGLAGRYRRRRRRTTVVDPNADARPDLIGRDFAPDAAAVDTHWCGDITYVPDRGGLVVSNHCHRHRLPPGGGLGDGRSPAHRPGGRGPAAGLRPTTTDRSVIFQSDRGCQYTSAAYAQLAARLGVRLSVGRTGQCWDNALAESFFAAIKGELLDQRSWPTRAAARSAIFEFIEGWYNLHRPHSGLGYRSPADFEAAAAA